MLTFSTHAYIELERVWCPGADVSLYNIPPIWCAAHSPLSITHSLSGAACDLPCRPSRRLIIECKLVQEVHGRKKYGTLFAKTAGLISGWMCLACCAHTVWKQTCMSPCSVILWQSCFVLSFLWTTEALSNSLFATVSVCSCWVLDHNDDLQSCNLCHRDSSHFESSTHRHA